jgi:hypothetical protein
VWNSGAANSHNDFDNDWITENEIRVTDRADWWIVGFSASLPLSGSEIVSGEG